MADSGLEDIMKSGFSSVSHTLTGKTFPQNVKSFTHGDRAATDNFSFNIR